MDLELGLALGVVVLPGRDCFGLSPHPFTPRRDHVRLDWSLEGPEHYRVHAFSCSCQPVCFELISRGGFYLIHRVTQLDRSEHAFTGAWFHSEARRWWLSLMLGNAR
ncbi:hypothetical protein AB0J35_40350 [Nonomuraea angiospora]|uniref:hypothetical protein n=1 Tax=Nonomuraea angiospora TaxID=46172 RepID=UPI00344055D6